VTESSAVDVTDTTFAGLTKVDRTVSVFFISKRNVKLSASDEAGKAPETTPQAFGTSLEN